MVSSRYYSAVGRSSLFTGQSLGSESAWDEETSWMSGQSPDGHKSGSHLRALPLTATASHSLCSPCNVARLAALVALLRRVVPRCETVARQVVVAVAPAAMSQ